MCPCSCNCGNPDCPCKQRDEHGRIHDPNETYKKSKNTPIPDGQRPNHDTEKDIHRKHPGPHRKQPEHRKGPKI